MSNAQAHEKMAVIINHDGMGRTADADLGRMLIDKWLALVEQNGKLPGAICFYTDGVRLVCDGSPVLERLRSLERGGVHLIVCKTCLDYLGLADKLAVGVIGGMGDIIAAQWTAEKVLTL